MDERFFNVLVLANDERRLVLRVLDIVKLVEVGLPLHQEVYSSWVSIVSAIVERCPLSVVLGHDVGTLFQQKFNAFLATLLARKV